MPTKQKNVKTKISWNDTLAALFAFVFTGSVIDNVHAYVTSTVQNSPATYALIISLALVVYGWYKNKKSSLMAIETMAVLVTAVAIWGFGLHGWLR